jgi:hypothetical protein
MNTTTITAADRLSGDQRTGTRSGKHNAALTADALHAQGGACWLCGESLTLAEAEADRLSDGRAMGRCAGSAQCASDCRCAYLPGNVGAAHAECHRPGGVRDALTDAQVATLATRYLPTAEAMTAARRERRTDAGRDRVTLDRRIGAALSRCG